VLGIAGLLGAGRTRLLRGVFGLLPVARRKHHASPRSRPAVAVAALA